MTAPRRGPRPALEPRSRSRRIVARRRRPSLRGRRERLGGVAAGWSPHHADAVSSFELDGADTQASGAQLDARRASRGVRAGAEAVSSLEHAASTRRLARVQRAERPGAHRAARAVARRPRASTPRGSADATGSPGARRRAHRDRRSAGGTRRRRRRRGAGVACQRARAPRGRNSSCASGTRCAALAPSWSARSAVEPPRATPRLTTAHAPTSVAGRRRSAGRRAQRRREQASPRSTITEVALTAAVAATPGARPELLDRVARDRGGDEERTRLDLHERHHAVDLDGAHDAGEAVAGRERRRPPRGAAGGR